VAASCLMPSKATISFQALSLNAPQNWAINRPRRGCEEVSAMDEGKGNPLSATHTMMNYCRKIKGNEQSVSLTMKGELLGYQPVGNI
jgi:hypothetical protein